MSNKSNLKEKYKETNQNYNTYYLTGSMKIISNEDEFTYELNVGVKDKKYYKVSLLNNLTGNEQIILKNDDGVYVFTPGNNKSFKFTSEWPNNSSQSYLLESLLNDVLNDSASTVKENEDGYIINTKVNYPNNIKMKYELIYLDKKFNVKKVEVKNEEDQTLIEINISKIDYNTKFDTDFFTIDEYINDDDNNECKKEDCNVSNILDDIIYPLYVPSDTYLSSKDTIDTDEGNRVILTFAGINPFILVEEVNSNSKMSDIIPVSGEPLLLGNSIAALSSKSLYWTSNGIDFYLTSSTLNSSEMMMVAESIINSNSLVSSLK